MSMADRSRSPRRPVKKHVWVKVRGSARAIKIDAKELHDVDALLEAVKDKEKQKLGGVDSGDLQLFQSEEAKDGGYEALQPDLRVTEITGGEEMKKPLYVFFPDAEVATASEALNKSGSALSSCFGSLVCFIVFGFLDFLLRLREAMIHDMRCSFGCIHAS